MPSQQPPSYDDAIASPAQRERAASTTSPSSANPTAPLTRAQTTTATMDIDASQRRSQRRNSVQPLPAYTRSRADDPTYIGALEQWAQTKMYVVPGQDGTFCSMGWGTVQGKGKEGTDEQRRRAKETERLERMRRGSRAEGEHGGEGIAMPRAERRGSGIRNMLRRLSTR